MTGLVQTSWEETMPFSSSPLILRRDSFSPWTWARFQRAEHSLLWRMSSYIFDIQWCFVYPDKFVPGRYFRINEFSGLLNRPLVQTSKSVLTLFVRTSEISGLSEPGLTKHHCTVFYHLAYLCNNFYGLSALVGCRASAVTRRIIYNFFNVCPFHYTAFVVSGKVGIPLTGLTTPVGWLLLPQLTVLSRSAIVV